MKIVIAGIGKSGTTALTYKIAAALPNCGVVFEPVQRRPLLETGHDTVVKISLRGDESAARAASYSDFDRKILLVRDPRDWLVSTLLYLWYSRVTGRREFRRFIGLLERKEADPGSVDFVDLIPPSMPLQRQLEVLRSAVDMGTDLVGQGWYRFHYEDMVNGEFTGLDDYLGFAVAAQAEVAAKHRRVVRSKAVGNWRHWLTASDVERLRPELTGSLRQLGCPTDDWRLAAPQILDPVLGSVYVRSLRGTALQRGYRIARRMLKGALRY